MSEKASTVRLQGSEATYLESLIHDSPVLAPIVTLKQRPNSEARDAIVKTNQVETLREFFTLRLAEIGFNADYAPNEDGKMLETLIDRFFIP